MSFEFYLKHWIGSYFHINEKKNNSTPLDIEEISNQITLGIGGDTEKRIDRTSSFESIEKVLEKLDISILEKVKDNPETQRILLELVSPTNIKWLNEYLKKSKKSLNTLASEKKKIDLNLNFNGFTKLTIKEASIKNKIYKLYIIFKYAESFPELDKDTNILIALKQIKEPLTSVIDGKEEKLNIGRIGRIDNSIESNEFEVLDSSGKSNILKKEDLQSLLEENPNITEKAKALAAESHKKKVSSLTQRTEDVIKKEVAASISNTEKIISELPNTEKTMEKLQVDWKPLIDALGYSKFFSKEINNKEKKIISEEKPSLRKKNRIKDKLMSALRHALLPYMVNGEISEPGGDYYKLFKKLESQNSAWIEAAIKEMLVDVNRINQFNSSARKTESPLEENQLAYLQISESWILKYIQSEVDGELSKRDNDNAISKIKSISLEKEKEIKNYYLSKDFNMANFKGIQLKPKVALPLYKKVKLIVSEQDRITNSPLKTLMKGIGQIAKGLVSTIQYDGNPEVARRNYEQNKAIFNGIYNIIKGGIDIVSTKGGEAFEKGVNKISDTLKLDAIGLKPYEKEKKANEDVGGTVSPGTFLQTPSNLPTNNMDTLALAGPGKKKKKSIVKKVSNFSDFLKTKN